MFCFFELGVLDEECQRGECGDGSIGGVCVIEIDLCEVRVSLGVQCTVKNV